MAVGLVSGSYNYSYYFSTAEGIDRQTSIPFEIVEREGNHVVTGGENAEDADNAKENKTAEECYLEAGSVNSMQSKDADETGTRLGIGFLLVGNMGYGMTASEIADPETGNPVIRVKLALGDGTHKNYDIDPSKVDPHNATSIEMFAYCQYADAHGMGVHSTFGSWNAMKSIVSPMGLQFSSLDEGINEKINWSRAIADSDVSLQKQITGEMISSSDVIKMLITTRESFSVETPYKDWRDMNEDEWNKFLHGIDSKIDEIEEAVKEETEKAKAIRKAQAAKETENKDITAYKTDLLTARYTSYSAKATVADPDSKTGEIITTGYIDRTFYTSTGIICERAGYNSKQGGIKDELSWKVDFNNPDDYDRTMKFLDRLPESDNTIFTTREYFWQDFVNGEINEDEFFDFYKTLDHGVANFIKEDGNGGSYIDKEMMSSKYFKYFGLQQVSTFPEEDLQRALEISALKDRGYDHTDETREDAVNVYEALREAFESTGANEFQFYGEDKIYSINEWIQEIIRRAHMGLADSLFMKV